MALALAQRRPALAAAIFGEHRMRVPWAYWPTACFRLAKAGKAELAARWADEAIEAEPRNAESHACAALIKLELGRPLEALRHIGCSLEISPDNAKYAITRKRALAASSGAIVA